MLEIDELLEAQRAIHDMIVRQVPLDVSLTAITQLMESQLPSALVSVMLFAPDHQTLSLVSVGGLSGHYRESVRGLPIGSQAGTCGMAAFHRETVITQDISQADHWQGYHGLARQDNAQVCWSIPVVNAEGELLGIVAVYYRTPRVPNDQEWIRIRHAAGLVALAIGRQQDTRKRESAEQRYRSLFTQHPDAVFEFDLQGRFRSCNQATSRITGVEESQILGMHFDRFIAKRDLTATHAAFACACQGEPQHYKLTSVNAAGQRHMLEITNLPIMVDNQVTGVYGIARDVSQRQQQGEELRLLKRGIEASNNGVIMADAAQADLPLVYVNTPFLKMTGYARDEVLGHNCRFLQGPDTDRGVVAQIRRAIIERRDIQVTLRNYRKDGEPFWNQLSLGPVFDERGRCTHFIGIQQDITQQRQNEERLAYQVSHDLLTGLPNRQSFEARLQYDHRLSRQRGEPLAVLYIDLDEFKPINDGVGHLIGDKLLIAVAYRLKALLESGDSVARLSGDEFAILLASPVREHEVIQRAELALDSLSRPFEIDEYTLHISASIGIASNLEDVPHANALIQHADLAMQEAKQQGRNIWQWYGGNITNLVNEHVVLRRELYEAISEEQFELHYQPIVETVTGRLCGVEALVRWRHPSKGMVSPGIFIPLAEQTGQIITIGRWVLRRACLDMAALQAAGNHALPVAVNISPLQFRRDGFYAEVCGILQESGLPPGKLELEVTEGVLMSGADKAIELLEALRSLGIQVAIDDFGTGFSSLSYLRQLPINKIKLDRSFICDITTNQANAAIVQGIITMAHHLGLLVVAEGIETREQQADLECRKCDLLQGFRFSKPVPLATLANLPERLSEMTPD